MNPVIYTFIPISIALILQLIFPYFKYIYCLEFWIVPPFYFCIMVFLATYVLFGILLWKSTEIQNNEIFILTWILIVLNLIWVYSFAKYKKFSLTILFLCLLIGYFTYNAVFLSVLSDPNGQGLRNSTTLYINLMSVYIVWIGMMITILIESASPDLAKKFLDQGKKKFLSYIDSNKKRLSDKIKSKK